MSTYTVRSLISLRSVISNTRKRTYTDAIFPDARRHRLQAPQSSYIAQFSDSNQTCISYRNMCTYIYESINIKMCNNSGAIWITFICPYATIDHITIYMHICKHILMQPGTLSFLMFAMKFPALDHGYVKRRR